MSKKLYVGNLDVSVSDSDLRQLFSRHGSILSAKVVLDRDTNQSKGFGFVELATEGEARAAITALNGKDHGGSALNVREAKLRPKTAPAGEKPEIANAPE